MNRRSSQDEPTTQRPQSTLSVAESDFADTNNDDLHDLGVSDGFRPNASLGRAAEEPRRASINAKLAAETLSQPISQTANPRSSIAKLPFSQDTSNPSNDDTGAGQSTSSEPQPSIPLTHRESAASTGSFVTDARSSTPTGPSHPYGMYTQGVARSASNATSATIRPPERSYSGNGPMHPYGMYPQNVEEDVGPAVSQQSIPVGFHQNTAYERRIGPDGEEQDIVGPDGHTEQLPPYSRYPVDAPKAFATASTGSPSSSAPVAPAANQSPVAQPDEITTAQTSPSIHESPVVASSSAQTASQSTAQSPSQNIPYVTTTDTHDFYDPRARSNRSSQRSATGTSQALSPAPSTDGKAIRLENEPKRGWLHRRIFRKRIPVWLVVLMFGLVILFAIILGAAVGSVFTKARKEEEREAQEQQGGPQATPSLYGATEITTPTNVPLLNPGDYSVPIDPRNTEEMQQNCIAEPNQLNAWDCAIINDEPLELIVLHDKDFNKYGQGVGLEPLTPLSYPIRGSDLNYGVQPIKFAVSPTILVTDFDARSRGPAWHTQGRYDKLVIVKQDSLPNGIQSQTKRDTSYRHDVDHRMPGPRRGDFRDGTQSSDDSEFEPGDNFQMSNGFKRRGLQSGEFPWFCYWNQTFIEIYMYPQQLSQAASAISSRVGSPTSAPTMGVQTATAFAGNLPSSSGGIMTPSATPSPTPVQRRDEDEPYIPDVFPFVLKIEERRIPQSEPAYCQQMQVLENGEVVPATLDGGLITYTISEKDPSYPAYASAEATSSNRQRRHSPLHKFRRDEPSDGCHCQWVVQ